MTATNSDPLDRILVTLEQACVADDANEPLKHGEASAHAKAKAALTRHIAAQCREARKDELFHIAQDARVARDDSSARNVKTRLDELEKEKDSDTQN